MVIGVFENRVGGFSGRSLTPKQKQKNSVLRKSLHRRYMGVNQIVIMTEFEAIPDSGAGPLRQRIR